jgi:hypothetical protein
VITRTSRTIGNPGDKVGVISLSDLLTWIPFDKQIKGNNPGLFTWIPFDKQKNGNNPKLITWIPYENPIP